MKLLTRLKFLLSLPLRGMFNRDFFSQDMIYLVVPSNDDEDGIDIDRIVVYYHYEDAEREMEYLQQFYDQVTIKYDTLNFMYLEE